MLFYVKNSKKFLVLLIFLLAIVVIYKYQTKLITKTLFLQEYDPDSVLLLLRPFCDCLNEEIIVRRTSGQNLIVEKFELSTSSKRLIKSYELTFDEFQNATFTCDLYNELNRGKGQRVVSYSIYGNNQKYYKNLNVLPDYVEKFYPNHIMRIYYENTLNVSLRCELECSFKNVDFCFVNDLKLSYTEQSRVNLAHMHKAMWRFMVIGDSFVDLFMSRDTDSIIIQREKDSVEEWLASNNSAHIMRDHPYHTVEVLAGMWGFRNEINRNLANELFAKMIDEKVYKRYSSKGKTNYGFDQYFLRDVVYPKVLSISTIHDSYHCKDFKNTKPFPTKRDKLSFIGQRVGSAEKDYGECPIGCRPKEHPDWKYC